MTIKRPSDAGWHGRRNDSLNPSLASKPLAALVVVDTRRTKVMHVSVKQAAQVIVRDLSVRPV
jgi:hypothetical protein